MSPTPLCPNVCSVNLTRLPPPIANYHGLVFHCDTHTHTHIHTHLRGRESHIQTQRFPSLSFTFYILNGYNSVSSSISTIAARVCVYTTRVIQVIQMCVCVCSITPNLNCQFTLVWQALNVCFCNVMLMLFVDLYNNVGCRSGFTVLLIRHYYYSYYALS